MKVLEKFVRCFALVAVLGASAISMGCAAEEEPVAPAPAGGAAAPAGEAGSTAE